MKPERNRTIITAYITLFTVAGGIVAFDLANHHMDSKLPDLPSPAAGQTLAPSTDGAGLGSQPTVVVSAGESHPEI